LLFAIGAAAVASNGNNTNPMGIIAVWTIAGGCIAALYILGRQEKKIYQVRIVQARSQMRPAEDAQTIRHELTSLIPVFLCSAIFGNATKITHAFFLTDALEKTGMTYTYARNLYGILQLNSSILLDGSVLIALWMFHAFFDQIRESISKKDWSSFTVLLEKWMDQMLDHLLPATFTIIVLARPIYQLLYGSSAEEAPILFAWNAGLGFLLAVGVVGWILLILMHRYAEAVVYLITGAVGKTVAFSFFLPHFGASGAVISSVLSTGVVVFLSYSKMNNVTEFNWERIALRACFILTACLAMNGAYLLLQTYAFDLYNGTGLQLFGELLLTVLCGFLVYRFVAKQMGLRKYLFHQED
jgi:O-antigen/teichoic acid export membrane protein